MPVTKGVKMYREKPKRMCYRDRKELDIGDAKDVEERDGSTGTTHRVTRFQDGSSTYHFGGPVGDVHYDEYGNEC